MARKKFEFKRYDYLGENKYFNAFNAIMSKNYDWLDLSEYTWEVMPTTITTTNVPTITATTGAESTRTRYYNWTASSNAMNSITYVDFPINAITTEVSNG